MAGDNDRQPVLLVNRLGSQNGAQIQETLQATAEGVNLWRREVTLNQRLPTSHVILRGVYDNAKRRDIRFRHVLYNLYINEEGI